MNNRIDAQSSEQWLPVVGHEGYYEVSDQGRVRSIRRDTPYVMKPCVNKKNGYHYYDLRVDGVRKNRPVHQMVYESHVGARDSRLEVCHNDGDPGNNSANNLRLDTRSSNTYDRVAHGVHYQVNKSFCPRGHELNDANNLPSMMGKGHRRCASCNRAMSYSRIHPEWKDRLQELSDSYYEKIVSVG